MDGRADVKAVPGDLARRGKRAVAARRGIGVRGCLRHTPPPVAHGLCARNHAALAKGALADRVGVKKRRTVPLIRVLFSRPIHPTDAHKTNLKTNNN